jgi:hypothetical protein
MQQTKNIILKNIFLAFLIYVYKDIGRINFGLEISIILWSKGKIISKMGTFESKSFIVNWSCVLVLLGAYCFLSGVVTLWISS